MIFLPSSRVAGASPMFFFQRVRTLQTPPLQNIFEQGSHFADGFVKLIVELNFAVRSQKKMIFDSEI